jgi:FtsZ-binding cell division protein ZapB
MAKAATPTSVEPIDRLEEKIKTLVSVIGRLRGEQSRIQEDNASG